MKLFDKIASSLNKTRDGFVSKLDNLFFRFKKTDQEFFDELEEILIMSDLGVQVSQDIIESVKKYALDNKIREPDKIKEILINKIKEIIQEENNKLELKSPVVILVIGVNGVGKTTSIAKLANLYKNNNKSVMLVAADTFRAAAVEQLEIWAKKIQVPVIKHQEGADPGAVIYDGIKSAKAHNINILICDTAGRLHNKINLMNELKKIYKIINQEYHEAQLEIFICLDATTGQNALQQVRLFNQVSNITGIILSKLDSSAKGGIIIAIQKELKIPVRYIGTGEKLDDLQIFDPEIFAQALFKA